MLANPFTFRIFRRGLLLLLLSFVLASAPVAQGQLGKAGPSPAARKQAAAAMEQGNTAYKAGRYQDAVNLYTQALKQNPNSSRTYLNRGLARQNLKAYKEALADVNRAVRLAPRSALAYHTRADLFVILGQYDRALGDMKNAFARYKNPPAGAFLSRGWAHYRKGEDDEALGDYDRALKKDPKLAAVYNNRALIWQVKGDFKRALTDLEAASKLNPKDVKPVYNRSKIHLAQGQYDQAIAACTKALAIDPRYAPALHNRGWAYQLKNEFEKALAEYNTALAIDRNLTQTYINRGIVFFKQRFLVQAIEDLTRAIKLDGRNSWSYYHRGKCLSAQGKHEAAIADYSKAVGLAPKRTDIYSARADSYKNLGKADLAEADLQKARELGPEKKQPTFRRGLVARLSPEVAGEDAPAVAAVEHSVQRSTGFVMAKKDQQVVGRGTCWLIDKKRRWVVTNDHVASGYTDFQVYFPRYDAKGRLFTRTSQYLNQPGQIRAKLVATDPRRDLAILQLDSLPPGVPAIPLARTLPAPGDVVHSVGNSGTSYRPLDAGTLWTYKRGQVESIMPFLVNIAGTYRFEASVVRTASGTRPGDSGGPMVNDKGELVGVVATGEKGEAIKTNAISVLELKAFLRVGTRKLNAGKKTVVGVWRFSFPSKTGIVFARYSFREDGSALLENTGESQRGTYKFKDDQLIVKFPKFKMSPKITWETNDKFKAAYADGQGTFERW